MFDADLYAAIPFDSYSRYTRGSWLYGYAKDSDDPHYSHSDDVVPGIRLRYAPTKNVTLFTRSEYDARNDKAAYSDIFLRHRLADNFSWHAGYIGRDHRTWDYVPSLYNRYNWAKSSIASASSSNTRTTTAASTGRTTTTTCAWCSSSTSARSARVRCSTSPASDIIR